MKLEAFRPWFYAAAIYNAVWGGLASLFPNALFRWLGMPPINYPSMFQCIGMMVGVYAIGYWLIARDPTRFGPLVYVGLAGKILGPLGFLWAASQGRLPWSFGWVNVTNDVIWLPAFTAFALQVFRLERVGRPIP
jgi:small multidrug resistance pump